jgi:hypothetical protein
MFKQAQIKRVSSLYRQFCVPVQLSVLSFILRAPKGFKTGYVVQGGSNMTGTDLFVNKPHCAAAVRP